MECCQQAEVAIKALLLKEGINVDEIPAPIVEKAYRGKTTSSKAEDVSDESKAKTVVMVCAQLLHDRIFVTYRMCVIFRYLLVHHRRCWHKYLLLT